MASGNGSTINGTRMADVKLKGKINDLTILQ